MNRLLIVLITLFSAGFITAQQISPKEFQKAVSGGNVQLLDVRTYEEYLSGYIEHTMQANWNNQDEFIARIEALDKSKPVYIYCLSGGRSAQAQSWMLQNGFTQVTNLKGGIAAWNKENLDLIVEMVTQEYDLNAQLTKYTADQKVLVEISTSYCPPCRKMQPIIDELIAEKVTILPVDGTALDCPKYSVYSFPTFIVFQNGKEIARKEGIATKDELKKLLE